MEIGNIQSYQYIKPEDKETVYMSKGLYDEAKNANNDPNKTAVIFNNKVTAIENETLQSLKNDFPNDFKKYEDILIATNDVEKYLNKNSNNILNGSDDDKDKHGTTEKEESSDTKKTSNAISQPGNGLLSEFKGTIQKANSNIATANEILTLQISNDQTQYLDTSSDKTQEADPSTVEAKSGGVSNDKAEEPAEGDKSRLEELYEKQKKIQKQVTELNLKISKVDESEAKTLENRLTSLNAELASIQEQIMAQIKEGKA